LGVPGCRARGGHPAPAGVGRERDRAVVFRFMPEMPARDHGACPLPSFSGANRTRKMLCRGGVPLAADRLARPGCPPLSAASAAVDVVQGATARRARSVSVADTSTSQTATPSGRSGRAALRAGPGATGRRRRRWRGPPRGPRARPPRLAAEVPSLREPEQFVQHPGGCRRVAA
jgi:hypothetical protein